MQFVLYDPSIGKEGRSCYDWVKIDLLKNAEKPMLFSWAMKK
jgi:hypothetical protein